MKKKDRRKSSSKKSKKPAKRAPTQKRAKTRQAKPSPPDEILFEECIRFAQALCTDPEWNCWADSWLSGEDRGFQSAMSAAKSAFGATEITPTETVIRPGKNDAISEQVVREKLGAVTAWAVAYAAALHATQTSGALRMALEAAATGARALVEVEKLRTEEKPH